MKSFKVQHLDAMMATCPVGDRLLGIDHGTKTLGLALSDPAHNVATPLKTISRGKFEADVKALEAVIRDYGVKGLIIGWPLEMSGREGPRTQSVKDYMAMLAPRLNLWWAVWDERMSSDSAHTLMAGDMNLSFAKREKAVDALAAQFILQSALDFMAVNRI
ncbi:MAG: Holliday junction resolvase RuvX [Alphaproteobacteria bacterium]|nr:Holliday junction resolvase RuvX [Alphaproteobacteria bacterium]